MASTSSTGPKAISAAIMHRIRLVLWLGVAFVLLLVGAYLPGFAGRICLAFAAGTALAVAVIGLPLALSLIRHQVLWRLRNKLFITYLLVGLAPVVLFCALFTLAAYVAAGQFAIHLATTRLDANVASLQVDSTGFAQRLQTVVPRIEASGEGDFQDARPVIETMQAWQAAAYVDGKSLLLRGALGHARSPLFPPSWFVRGTPNQYHGMVLEGSNLYLASMTRQRLSDGRTLITIGSIPVNNTLMESVAHHLGAVRLSPSSAEASSGADGQTLPKSIAEMPNIVGGMQPHAANFTDVSVHFLSSIPVITWEEANALNIPIDVTSRPSLLYNELFGSALTGGITSLLRALFFAVCILCGLMELLALTMAIRLNRSITQSVEDLYGATQRIDRGDLKHRIQVTRDDQMADLCSAFNRMSNSLSRLLDEQKEKERLQNEISIAQEVQANLFPLAELRLPTLELHGVCRPARSVSGDYYDFLVFHGQDEKEAAGASIAIGDISGKGISAALLMATLHSAVRAYRFGSGELAYAKDAISALNARRSGVDSADVGNLFESPGKILALLNHHLYRSTQPEKYATLFLAHYEELTRKLSYSNAGHLPPIMLCKDGSIRRLERGGTVVGLMDGMRYDEGSLIMGPGDLLIAFSDGVTEPENDFGEFGEARLIEVVRENREASLDVISSRVMEALDAWIGAEEQPDDITLVLARGV